jgi:hypothetical protein
VVVVTLNGTHGNMGFGGRAAAPVFHAVATEAHCACWTFPRICRKLPAPVVAGKRRGPEKDDLAIADTGSGEPNILEEK